MSVTADEAMMTAAGLLDASRATTVRQIKYELSGRANEWDRAERWLRECDDGAVIEMCSSVVPGMLVLHDEDGYMPVIRVLSGGLSLHVESRNSPQGRYRNFLHPTSPVVVKA